MWDGHIDDIDMCETGHANCDQNGPYSLLGVDSQAKQIAILQQLQQSSGFDVLFTQSIANTFEASGGAILNPSGGVPYFTNVLVFQAYPDDVVKHELGHGFQLFHKGITVSTLNDLMCGVTGDWDYLALIGCLGGGDISSSELLQVKSYSKTLAPYLVKSH